MLPRFYYELLPYACIWAGVGVVWTLPLGPAHLFAAMLYLAGTLIWVLRSDARRQDGQNNKHVKHHLRNMSPLLYEVYPFLMLAAALWVAALAPTPVAAASFAIAAYPTLLLWKRVINRGHGWVKFLDRD
jgi:membrane protein implicated in regulation of membrane protease activity